MMIHPAQVVAPFIAPALAWAGVALVSVPVAIHLLSRWRRRPQPWGAMRFLLEAYRRQKRRMRLEQWLQLLLRCLIVLMLGLALSRPLLVGALGSWFGGLDSGGRVVNLVIDDAMSLRADGGQDATRFDRLIAAAESVVNSLEPGDRATLWRAGRPAGPVIAEPTGDRAELRRVIAQLRPGYSRPDVPASLTALAESIRDRRETSTQSVTFLLSDFARSSRYIEQPLDTGQPSFAEQSEFVVMRPLSGTHNVQVRSVRPQRRVVWVGGSVDAGVSAEVSVARYTQALEEASVGVTVELIDPAGRGLSSVRRQIAFSSGQREATLGIDLPIGASPSWLDARGGTVLTIRAQLGAVNDGLAADNQAHAAVELRRRMRVAVVDEPVDSAGSGSGLSPGQWVTLALNPQTIGPAGLIEVVPITPTELNDPRVFSSLDAVMLMRPDRLIRPAWRGLSAFAQAGGLVWVFTPTDEGSSPWVTLMLEQFDPGWRVGLEAVDPEGGALGLVGGPLRAEPLEQLAADWQALTRPLRVRRYLPTTADNADAWMRLAATQAVTAAEGAEEAVGRGTLLAHHRVGLGSLLFLSTAVDTRWTNLPTKPLFVPLIHETLHGELGTLARPGIVYAVSGDLPVLGASWVGVTRLDRLQAGGDLTDVQPNDEAHPSMPELKTTEAGPALAGPVAIPGVYQATTAAGPRRLIVDADQPAGDTRQIDEEALIHWLDGLGAWRWFDEDDPGAALRRSAELADIGWALLWVVLALVILETVAARLLSHANVGPGRSLTGGAWRAALRLRNGEKATRKKGKAA